MTDLEDLAFELFDDLGFEAAGDDAVEAEQAKDGSEGDFLVDEFADRVFLCREVDAGDQVWVGGG